MYHLVPLSVSLSLVAPHVLVTPPSQTSLRGTKQSVLRLAGSWFSLLPKAFESASS
jgi:hypothetical protein